jgi:hypothetical protein
MPEGVNVCPNCGTSAIAPDPATAPPQLATSQPLPMGDYLKTGWELFKQYPGGFVGFFLLYIFVQAMFNSVPRFGWAIAVVIGTPMILGNFIVAAKLLQKQKVDFADFFAGFQFFLPLVLLTLVSSVMIGLGFVLLIIPGIYLAVAYLFASILVIDQRLDFWPAMELSRNTVTPTFFAFFAFSLVLLVINAAGALLLGLGLFVTVPVSVCALTAAYADIFGLHSDYSGKVPSLQQD